MQHRDDLLDRTLAQQSKDRKLIETPSLGLFVGRPRQHLGDRADAEILKRDIAEFCRRVLPAQKVPAVIRFVPSLDVTDAGKLARR